MLDGHSKDVKKHKRQKEVNIKRNTIVPKEAYQRLFTEWFSVVENLNYFRRQDETFSFLKRWGALISKEDAELSSFAIYFLNVRLKVLSQEGTFEASQKSILLIGDIIFKHFAYFNINQKIPFIRAIGHEILHFASSLDRDAQILHIAQSTKKWSQLLNYIPICFEIFSMYASLQLEYFDLQMNDGGRVSFREKLLKESPEFPIEIVQVASQFGNIFSKMGDRRNSEEAYRIASHATSWIQEKILDDNNPKPLTEFYIELLQKSGIYLEQLGDIISEFQTKDKVSAIDSAIIELKMLWHVFEEDNSDSITSGEDQTRPLSNVIEAFSSETRDISNLLRASINIVISLSEKIISLDERKLFLRLYLKWREVLPEQGVGATLQTRILNELWGEISASIGKRFQKQNTSSVKSTSASKELKYSPIDLQSLFLKWFELAENINSEERTKLLFRFYEENKMVLRPISSRDPEVNEERNLLRDAAINRLIQLQSQNNLTSILKWAGLFESILIDFFNPPSISFSFKACNIERVISGYECFLNVFYEDMLRVRDRKSNEESWAALKPNIVFYQKHLIEPMIAYRIELVKWAFQVNPQEDDAESARLRQRIKEHPEEYIKEAFLFGIQYALFLCVRQKERADAESLYIYLLDNLVNFRLNSLFPEGILSSAKRARLIEVINEQLQYLKSAIMSDKPHWFLSGIESMFEKSKFLAVSELYRLLGVTEEIAKDFDDDLESWQSKFFTENDQAAPTENRLIDQKQPNSDGSKTPHIDSVHSSTSPQKFEQGGSLTLKQPSQKVLIRRMKAENARLAKQERVERQQKEAEERKRQAEEEARRIAAEVSEVKIEEIYPQQMIFRVGAERSRRRSVHKVHDCGENREGNNPENSGVKGIKTKAVQEDIVLTSSPSNAQSKTRKKSRRKTNLDAARDRRKLEEKRLHEEAMLEASKQNAKQETTKKVARSRSPSLQPKEGNQAIKPSLMVTPLAPPPINVWEEKRRAEAAKVERERIEAEQRRRAEEVEVERQRIEAEQRRRAEEVEVERQHIEAEQRRREKEAEAEKAKLEKEKLEKEKLESSSEAIGVKALENLTSEFEQMLINEVKRPERASSSFEVDESFVASDIAVQIPPPVAALLWSINLRGRRAYLTGGAVRDLLLAMPIRDVDIVAECSESELNAILGYCVSKNPHIREADVYRVGYYDIVLKSIDFSLKEDAAARDYEPNGFYADCHGRVFDVLEHLQNLISGSPIKLICSNPIEKLIQDPIRILRGIDLQNKLKRPLAPEVQEAITATAMNLNRIPFGALKCHLSRMFLGGRAAQNFCSFEKYNLLPYLFPRFGSDFAGYWFRTKNLSKFIKSQCSLIDHHLMIPESTPISDLFVIALLIFPGVRKMVDQYSYNLTDAIQVQLDSFFELKSVIGLDGTQLFIRDCLKDISERYEVYQKQSHKKETQIRRSASNPSPVPQWMTPMYNQNRVMGSALESRQADAINSTSNILVNNKYTHNR